MYSFDNLDLGDALDRLNDDRGLHDHDYRLCDHYTNKNGQQSAPLCLYEEDAHTRSLPAIPVTTAFAGVASARLFFSLRVP